MKDFCVASCSMGKDSLAMVLRLLETGSQLDEVVFYDTGMEFNAIYKNRDQLRAILDAEGIKFTVLEPSTPFLYDMLKRPVYSAQKGHHNGYGWCGGVCRWGTARKMQALNTYAKSIGATKHFIGIAYDEPDRNERLAPPKVSPLFEWKMTEADCLAYCRGKGFSWQEGDVDLYAILDRVSCWCCANKNRKELKNMYEYLPAYWERLKMIQNQLDRPMKKLHNAKYGDYGNVFDMERVFAEEIRDEC